MKNREIALKSLNCVKLRQAKSAVRLSASK